ncbi:MAG: haloacid dehalogenase type II [Paracoccaceae bacterium]
MKYSSIVFDAYGTLFDINAAAQKSALVCSNSSLQSNWKELAELWRTKQIEYTWLQNILNNHTDFLDITKISLDFALEEMMLDQEPKLKETLLDLYQTSEAYSEVVHVLEELNGRGIKLSILSNGTPEMLFAACASSRIEKLLDFIVSVEEIGIFKPDGRVYELVNTKMGYKISEVLFVSSNGWDIMGAAKFGFSTAWINRNKKPVERMQWKPNYELSNLMHIIDLLK